MKNHIKTYLDAVGTDVPMSEMSGKKAQDIHHIIAGGMGGSARKEDRIENLMALTREEHTKYGDQTRYMCKLLRIHYGFLLRKKIPFDKEWIKTKLKKYSYE